MARALRVVVPGGWYHITARGNRKAALFLNDQDRKRFLGLVIEDNDGSVGQVVRYVHLNPVRIQGLGLGKSDLRKARVLGCPDPGRELVQGRLKVLREWLWSSWRAYGGAEPEPPWLEVRRIRGSCGGRSAVEQKKALREYTEEPLRQGTLESPWERLVGGLVLRSELFAQRILKKGSRRNREEQTAVRELEQRGRPILEDAIRAAETLLKRPWNEMLEAHGDWGRDGVLNVLVRHARFRLPELLGQLPGVRYSAAAQAIQRFGKALPRDVARARFTTQRYRRQLAQISNDEMRAY